MFNKISVKVTVLVNLILLVVMVWGTFFLIRQQFASLEARYKEQGKFVSILGARSISRLLEDAVDNKALSIADVFDTNYVLIPGFEPAKYHTRYDAYADSSFQAMEDEFLTNKNIVFAVAVDRNGYVATHNSKYQQKITGDKEDDRQGNRTKRLFNNPVEIKGAKNKQDGFVQVYKRDSGEIMWDIASPIYVKGKHWGNFRMGLSILELEREKSKLLFSLLGIMAVILVISISAIMYIVKTTLNPLTEFTRIASKMADGDVNEKIVSTSKDEIGELAMVLERMRISLKLAMERLMKK